MKNWISKLFAGDWGKLLIAAIVGSALTATGLPPAVIGTIATSAGNAVDSAADGLGQGAESE
ncbi:hypothetical protein [Alloalcanivorax mobilis]|uniref:hypothetical protein n=1 Tax=Alloalcanivorax mobilis TaxID=2019569 RepID=UPI000C777BF3|nr:hypothetical protein [Alloalcanivorax mobilis]